MTKQQKFIAAEFTQGNRASIGIEKLHLEEVRREHFNDCPNSPGNQALGGLVVQQGDHIK